MAEAPEYQRAHGLSAAQCEGEVPGKTPEPSILYSLRCDSRLIPLH
jgi:hypothetical protein